MKKMLVLIFVCVAGTLSAQKSDQSLVSIVNVNLVDVEQQKIIPNVTVQFSNGKIQNILKGGKPVTSNRNIDGTGKYLIPGMTDAHIHFFQSGGLYTRPDAIDLKKFVPYEKELEQGKREMADVMRWNIFNGITSVIDVGATYNLLNERTKYVDSIYAPTVYMTGPLLTTYEPAAFKGLGNDRPFSLVQTEDEARKMVQEQLAFKPDFIKIWYIVLGKNKEEVARKHLPVIKAVIDEAHKNNLKVAVHATERIAAQLSVENGADFLVHSVDDEVVPDSFVRLLKEKKTILCPTLVVAGNYNKVFAQENHFHPSEFQGANPFTLGTLFDLQHLPDAKIQRYRDVTRKGKAEDKTTDSICPLI